MSGWLPSLNALRAFEAVSRHLNYAAAAAELNVTPAAVKQLVRKLETSLGVSLLRRKGRGLELTSDGMRGQSDLAQSMKFAKSAVAKMRKADQEKRLVVSVESSLATLWLVPRLENFRAAHPNVTVLIDSRQTVVDLEKSSTDIGIRYGVKTHENLQVHRLFDDEVFPVCSPELAENALKEPTLQALVDLPLIHWDLSGTPWARKTKSWFTWDGWLTQADTPRPADRQGPVFQQLRPSGPSRDCWAGGAVGQLADFERAD